MKKELSLILTFVLCLFLCACGGKSKETTPVQSSTTEYSAEITEPEVSTPTTDAKHPAEYVGEWKNYKKINSEGDFGTYRVVFYEDGSGSYFNSSDKETKGDWYYDADNQ